MAVAVRLSVMIRVDHLTKSYRGVTAVDDVSFCARPGRVTGFLGPNGAGKSTTMRIMVQEWAQLGSTSLIKIGIPLVVGVAMLRRSEVK